MKIMRKREVDEMRRAYNWLAKVTEQGKRLAGNMKESGAKELIEEIVEDLEQNGDGVAVILKNMEKAYERERKA